MTIKSITASLHFDKNGKISRKGFLKLAFFGMSSSLINACSNNQLESSPTITVQAPIVSTEVIKITPSPTATLIPTPTPTVTPAPTPTVNLEATRLAITTRDLLQANLTDVIEVSGYTNLEQFPDEVNLSTEDRILVSQAEIALLEAYVKTEDCFGVVANGPLGPKWGIFSIPTTTLRAYRPFYILTSRRINIGTSDALFNSIKVDALQNLADITDSQITLNFHPSFADEETNTALIEREPRFILNIGQQTLASINELTLENTGALANSQIDNQPTIVVLTNEGEEILHTATETANNAPASITFMHGMTGRIYKAAAHPENPSIPDLLSPQLQLSQDHERNRFWQPTTIASMEQRIAKISESIEGRQNIATGIGVVNGLEIPIGFSFGTNGLFGRWLVQLKQDWYDVAATAFLDSSRTRHNIREGTRYSLEEFAQSVRNGYGATLTPYLEDNNASETMFDPRNGYIINFVTNPNLPIVQSTSHNGTPLGFTLPRLDIQLADRNSPLIIYYSQDSLAQYLTGQANLEPEANPLVYVASDLVSLLREISAYLATTEIQGIVNPKGIDLASFIRSSATSNKIAEINEDILKNFEIEELLRMQIGPEDNHPFAVSISKQ